METAEEEGYIKTTTHNYVSRRAVIDGARQVEIKGRTILHDGVRVRGDLQTVRMGRYCEVGSSTLLEPPPNPYQKERWIPMVIGSHTHIGSHCEIRAAAVGSSKYHWSRDRVDFLRNSTIPWGASLTRIVCAHCTLYAQKQKNSGLDGGQC
jgi:hypothetical protein